MNSLDTPPKITSNLLLTAIASSTLTLVSSVIYVALCIVALVFRSSCGEPSTVVGSGFFLNTLYRTYFQVEECPNAITIEGITGEHSVFVLVAITLSAAIVSLVAAIILISAVITAGGTPYLSMIVYGYVGVYVASLAVDITFAAHFGMDYTFLNNVLNNSSPGLGLNYERDLIRIGAFILMTIVLKAFIGHVINIVLIVLLVVYLVEYANIQQRNEHPIHKMEAIQAFDSNRDRQSNQPYNQREPYQHPRGPQINYGYIPEEPPRSPMRDSYTSDYLRSGIDRSNSWQPGPGPSSRPFSYLEDVKRPIAVKPPSSPAVEPPGRDHWRTPAPPVPAPDYSPTPRRLKSALKSGYM